MNAGSQHLTLSSGSGFSSWKCNGNLLFFWQAESVAYCSVVLSADSDGDQVQTGWMDSNGFEAEKMLYFIFKKKLFKHFFLTV